MQVCVCAAQTKKQAQPAHAHAHAQGIHANATVHRTYAHGQTKNTRAPKHTQKHVRLDQWAHACAKKKGGGKKKIVQFHKVITLIEHDNTESKVNATQS